MNYKNNKDLIILGIDPGTIMMGFGIIKINNKKIELLTIYQLSLKKINSYISKLEKIFQTTLSLIDNYNPNEIAIEAPFLGKNIQSMVKLIKAQSIAIAAGLYRKIPITEYQPRKIKMAVTGNGNASKEQVFKMVNNLLNIKYNIKKELDAFDGLATAICHYFNLY